MHLEGLFKDITKVFISVEEGDDCLEIGKRTAEFGTNHYLKCINNKWFRHECPNNHSFGEICLVNDLTDPENEQDDIETIDLMCCIEQID